jgi:hypothetical protein
MTRVIRFHTATRDLSSERLNPINPIPGESLLLWLSVRAKPKTAMTLPAPEDWGWYSEVRWEGRHYMIGASASPEDGGDHAWVLQVVKSRSFGEKLLGRQRMTAEDSCARFFQELLEKEPTFKGLSVDS